MTWKEWELHLMEGLNPLSLEERAKIAEYYQEMYGDKLEAGIPEEEILKEFGDPKACAQKILLENGEEITPTQEVKKVEPSPTQPQVEKQNTPQVKEPQVVKETVIKIEPKKEERSIVSRVFAIIGFIVLTLLSVFAVLVLGAFALTFACVALSGSVYSIATFAYGLDVEGTLANFGAGLALIGVGILLSLLFAWLTKIVGLGCKKQLTSFFERRIKA